MAKTVDQYFEDLQQTRVWRSVFRSGSGSSTLKRALAIQQNVFLHLFSTKVRTRMLGFSATWYLGTLTLGTFLLLVATGIPLMLYYHPSVPQAYADTKDLEFVVSSGLFLRNLHRWSAHAMVFLVFAHMFKVFYRGAYRAPREFNWVIGVVLLLITLLLSYTGYLLPWDQLAYWAITVGSNIASAVPVMGNKIHFLLLGGNAVNANALLRFYVLHCMILPLTAIFLVAIHFWRIRKDGGLYAHSSEPAVLRGKAAAQAEKRDSHGRIQGFYCRRRLQREKISPASCLCHAPDFGTGKSRNRRSDTNLSRGVVPGSGGDYEASRRAAMDRLAVQRATVRFGRSLSHPESGKSAMVFSRASGNAALLPTGRSRRACSRAGCNGADRDPLL